MHEYERITDAFTCVHWSMGGCGQHPVCLLNMLTRMNIPVQYRTWTNYKDLGYLVSRIGGQLVFSFIYFSLYWKAGQCT